MASDKLLELNCFVEVVKSGSFTSAAKTLDVSKSTVSKAIQSLEDRLGVKLFQRSTRRVHPTEAGLMYFDRVLPILRSLDYAEQSLSPVLRDQAGHIKVAAPVGFAPRYLAPIFIDFLKLFPNVRIQLVLSDHMMNLKNEGIDLAFRIVESAAEGLTNAKLIGRFHYVLVATPNYLKEHGQPKTWDDVAAFESASYALRSTGNFILRYNEEGGMERVRVDGRFVANNGESLLRAVEADFAMAYLPEFHVAEHLRDGRLVEVLPRSARHNLSLYAIEEGANIASPIYTKLIEMVRERLIEDGLIQ